MRIIGIDLSLTHPGWATFVGDRVTDFGPIDKIPTVDRMDRLKYIAQKYRALSEGSDWAVFEGYSFASTTQAYSLGELGGVVRFTLQYSGHRWIEIPPATLKKFVTGKGNALKSRMILAVYKRWKIDVDDDNQADAVGLAYVGAALKGVWEAQTKEQKEVIETIRHGFKKKFPANESAAMRAMRVEGGKP